MGYEILGDEELEGLLRKVFRDNPLLRSQAALSRALSAELDGRDARVSGNRLRRMALESGLAKLEIIYRRSDRGMEQGCCPVCAAGLEELENSTLEGGSVVIARVCRNCEFKSGVRSQEPGRYVFHARKG